MSLTLLKYTFKSNWLMLVIFCSVLFMYMFIMVTMYDPAGTSAMQELINTMSEAFVKAFNFESIGTGLTAFLASYFYGFLIILFPMVYCIILGNKLVAGYVDNSSMAYILSTPNSRLRIVTTQAFYILSTIVVLVCFTTLSGVVVSEMLFKGELDIGKFVILNVTALAMIWATSSICFFCSCLFNDARNSLAFGAGIPIGFFLIKMLAGISDNAKVLKSLSLFSLFDPSKVLSGDSSVWTGFFVFLAITIILYVGGIMVFNRKDLPL
jgi:ABC-2 type transport system permease protein